MFILIAYLFVSQAGITTAYQKKPCLNPYDPECPDTASNKHNKQVNLMWISHFFRALYIIG